jgi:hypothetical protein
MGREGFEPSTLGLRVRSSVMKPHALSPQVGPFALRRDDAKCALPSRVRTRTVRAVVQGVDDQDEENAAEQD